jgi:ketosteroid isomerase-like protein
MMTKTRTAGDLLRAYYRALDEPDLGRLDELLAADCEWRFPGSQLRGPGQVKESMARSLAIGLSMTHTLGHLLEAGETAICELVATNRFSDAEYRVAGAVVCEARAGRITRLAAYPDAMEMTAFLAGLREHARARRAESG